MAAPSYIGNGGIGASDNSATVAVPFPSLQAGDILFLQLLSAENDTHQQPSGFTSIGTVNQGTAQTSSWWWKRAVGTESGNLTCSRSNSGDAFFGIMSCWRGACETGTPFNYAGPTSGASTSYSSSAITPTNNYSTVICFCNEENNVALGTLTDYTTEAFDLGNSTGDDVEFNACYIQQTTKAAVAAKTGTVSPAQSWATVTLALFSNTVTTVSATKGVIAGTGKNPTVTVPTGNVPTEVNCTLGTVVVTGHDAVVGLETVVNVLAGGAQIDHLTNPATGTMYNCDADGRIVFTFTPEVAASNGLEVFFRRFEWNSFVEVISNNLGELVLQWFDGSWHEEAKISGVYSDGVSATTEIVYSGTSIIVSVDSVEKINDTIDYNLTVAQGRVVHDLDTNDLELWSYEAGAASGVVVTGFGTTVTKAYQIQASKGAIVVTGVTPATVTVPAGNVPTVVTVGATAAITTIGYDAAVSKAYEIHSTKGSIVVTGYDPIISIGSEFSTTLGTVVVTGKQPSVTKAFAIAASKGSIAVTGYDVAVKTDDTVIATTSAITVTGYDAVISAATSVACTLGVVTVTGYGTSISTANPTIVNVSAPEELLDSLSTPSNATNFDHERNGRIEFSFTYETGKTVEIYFRQTTAYQAPLVNVATYDNDLFLKTYDGGWNNIASSLDIFTNGVSYAINVIFDGPSIIIEVNDAEEINETVDFALNGTIGSILHDLATNDIELASYSTSGVADIDIIGYDAGVDLGLPFYVRADGTAATIDDAHGPENDAASCMSLTTHNAGSFVPGALIYVSGLGGTFRGGITFKGGNASKRITYEGLNTPVIDGTDVTTGWTNYSGNVWQKTGVTYHPQQIWIDGNYGDRKTSIVNCVNGYDWYYDAAADTIYLYAPGDPDTQYTTPGVEVPRQSNPASAESYVDIDGITIKRSYLHGFQGWQVSHIKFTSCIFEWNYNIGCNAGGDASTPISDVVLEDCIARYNGQQGISHNPLNVSNNAFIIRRCQVYENGRHQYADPRWDDSMLYSGGIKIWNGGGDSIIEDNRVYSNGPSGASANALWFGQGIWLDAVVGSSGHENHVRRNVVYDNSGVALYNEISDYNIWYNNLAYDNAKSGDSGVWSNGTIRCDAREGLTASYNKFYNNTCYGGHYGIVTLTTSQEANTEVSYNEYKNNIIVGTTAAKVYADTGGDNDGSNGTGNVYAYNCFDAEANDFISWGGTAYDTYDAWEAVYGGTTNSIEASPALKDTANDKYYLTGASPCINAGTNLGATYDDALDPRILASAWPDAVATLDQDLWGTGWEVGAYVYDGVDTAAVTVVGYNPTVILGTGVIANATLGAVTATAFDATLALPERILAASGAVTVTALQPEIEVETEVEVGAGAITVTGHNPVVTTGLEVIVPCTLGTITVTGLDAACWVPLGVDATLGTVVVTGHDALLNTSTIVLGTELGEFQKILLSPLDAVVQQKTAVAASVAAATVTGYDPSVWAPTGVSAGAGAISVVGYDPDVAIIQPGIPVTLGTVTVLPVSPAFAMKDWYPKRIDAQSKPITLLGKAASIIAPIIAATLGTVTVTGHAAEIHEAHIEVACTAGSVAVTGHNVGPHIVGVEVAATCGTIAVTGYDAAGEISAIIKADSGAVTVTGHHAVVAKTAVWATPGQVLLVGYDPAVVAPLVAGEAIGTISDTSKRYISYYQDWATHFPAEIARRWRQFLLDTFYIATPPVTVGGTANSLELTTDEEIVQITPGQSLRFTAAYTNTGGTILDVNEIGPQSVLYEGQPLKGGEIVAGGSYEVVFDGIAWGLTTSSRAVVGSAAKTWMNSGKGAAGTSWEVTVWGSETEYDDAAYFYGGMMGIHTIEIPENGRYRINGVLGFEDVGGAAGHCDVRLELNGVALVGSEAETFADFPVEGDVFVHFEYVGIFNTGDRIQLFARQIGSAATYYIGDDDDSRRASWWAIERLR